jgi:hypothetical protein
MYRMCGSLSLSPHTLSLCATSAQLIYPPIRFSFIDHCIVDLTLGSIICTVGILKQDFWCDHCFMIFWWRSRGQNTFRYSTLNYELLKRMSLRPEDQVMWVWELHTFSMSVLGIVIFELLSEILNPFFSTDTICNLYLPYDYQDFKINMYWYMLVRQMFELFLLSPTFGVSSFVYLQ